MLRVAVIATGFTVLVVTAAVAQSRLIQVPQAEPSAPQVPAQSDQPSHEAQKQQAAPDNRGTEQVPFVVKELPRERSQKDEEEAGEKAELDRKLTRYTAKLATYTAWLFGATLLLAFLTGALALAAFFQIRESRTAIKAAVDSAKATAKLAKAAADHAGHADRAIAVSKQVAAAQLRAYVHVDVVDMLYVNSDECSPNIRVKIKNFGSTPAYRVNHRCDTKWVIGEPRFFNLRENTHYSVLGPQQDYTTTIIVGRRVWQDIVKPGILRSPRRLLRLRRNYLFRCAPRSGHRKTAFHPI